MLLLALLALNLPRYRPSLAPNGRGGAGPPPHRLWPSAIFAAMLALDVNGEGSLDSNWGQGQV